MAGRVSHARRVSPGFTPRPSLSGKPGMDGIDQLVGVAGVHTSAFVEP